MEINTKYVKFQKKITDEGYKLICIHHAGGGASFFARWQSKFKNAEILPIQMPGRENRMNETAFVDAQKAADALSEELSPYLKDHNFSVFGHSMGGILSFELIKRLEKKGLNPDVCFISATSIEGLYIAANSVENLDEDEFMKRVYLFGGINPDSEILQFPEFREFFLKTLRADFELLNNYRDKEEKINCPICGMWGAKDPVVSKKLIETWKDYTTKEFTQKEYPGDHFYMNDDLGMIANDIENTIKKYHI